MEKEDIIKKLKMLDVSVEDYIIMGDSALVFHGLIDECDNIYLGCCGDVYEKKLSLFDQWFDVVEVLESVSVVHFDGYSVLDLETIYQMMVEKSDKKKKKIIEKLDLLLCSRDNYRYERKLKETGVRLIAGVDEVGRGPLIGPVVAACVILPDSFCLDGLTDSKKLSEKKRDFYYEEIMRQALSVGVGIISAQVIDQVNIYEATKLAMREAISQLSIVPDHILIDAMPLELDIPTTSIIKGDLKSITISAASVIAKVTRDRMLYELDEKYPMYGFRDHKGYPTKKHLEAIQKYGILAEHRRSYGPVRDYLMSLTKD